MDTLYLSALFRPSSLLLLFLSSALFSDFTLILRSPKMSLSCIFWSADKCWTQNAGKPRYLFEFNFAYTRFVLLPECHGWSAAPGSACLCRGPRGCFCSECCTNGESVAAPRVSLCQWRNWRVGRRTSRPPGKLNVKTGSPLSYILMFSILLVFSR